MNYKLTVTKSTNARCFYIQTSYRKRDGKVSTKTVRKLGREAQIKEMYGFEDAMEWAKVELAVMRQAVAEGDAGVTIELSPEKLIGPGERILKGGDIIIEYICGQLGLKGICEAVKSRYSFKFDLWEYMMRMVSCLFLYPGY